MKYILEIIDRDVDFAEKFFKRVSFIKKVKALKPNEITNSQILKSIELYEKGNIKPTSLSLKKLKAMLNA
jgi:hypothetical protein